MANCIIEKERAVPIAAKYDVAIVGGGIAGVSAALAAARHGKRVILLERMFALGGLATLGLVTIYLPLCDGRGRQVSFGIAEELLKLSIRYGYEADYPGPWLDEKAHKSQRFQVRYNAQVFAILLERIMTEAGVHILYGTSVVQLVKEEPGIIRALIVENKSGRSAIKIGGVVDASGDADVCMMAGAPTALYQKGNSLAAWFYETCYGETSLHMLGAADVLPEDGDANVPEQVQTQTQTQASRITGVDAEEVSNGVILSHECSLQAFLRQGRVSQAHSLTTLASIPQLRMTRRLCGEYTLGEDEIHQFQKDSVGMIGDWRKRGPVYEIPFGALYNEKIINLAAAGRCISATDEMWDVTRVIPACAVTGQAAGTAMALCANLNDLDLDLLQKTLEEDGVALHEQDLNLHNCT